MIDPINKEELLNCLAGLSVKQQRLVLDFASSLTSCRRKGVPGSSLLQFAGTIDADNLNTMSKAIDDGCGTVAPTSW